jgi:probable O-glycosylation ligase (exosortase A-associated)
MRDLILMAALAFIAGLTTRSTVIGLLTWIWVSLLSPQREVYGVLANFELNLYVALLTAFCWLLSKERKIFPINGVTGALILFSIWATISTTVALAPEHSLPLYTRTIKSVVLALAVATLANTPARIQATVWALALSVGYYGVRGGGFVMLTGGANKVFGPEDTMISDNNALGLALVVVLPLLNYLRSTSREPMIKMGLLGAMVLTTLGVLGTYSRGAFVALGAIVLLGIVRSRWAVVLLMAAAMALVAAPAVVPTSVSSAWLERMTSIQTAGQDESFAGRIAAWKTTLEIVRQRPLTGGGFSSTEVPQVVRAFPTLGGLTGGLAAHSIYFQVLGDVGVPGFIFYMLMVGMALFNTFRVSAYAKAKPDLAWAGKLAKMIQLSLFGFFVGGAALAVAYYDFYLVIFCLSAALAEYVNRQARAERLERDQGWRKTKKTKTGGAPAYARVGSSRE